MNRALANWVRFILGLVIALGLAVDSYFEGRGVGMTFVLPLAILLLSVADLIGYLADDSLAQRQP